MCHGGRKDWWTKKLTNNFYTAGRLTDRQVKYAAESTTYKSILSVFYFGSNGGRVYRGDDCADFYPSTSEYLYLARIAGIPYRHFPRGVHWLSPGGVKAFEKSVTSLPKPVLVHCYAGYSATGITLLYLLKIGQFTCDDVFRHATAAGYQYWTSRTFVSLASQLSTSPNSCRRTAARMTSNTVSPSWVNYWPAKRLTDCVYIAGQIQSDQIGQIKSAGFQTIANMRKGTHTLVTNKPSQEEVTLLNINSYWPSTYQNGGRQLRSNLLRARLDLNKPNSYISATSKDNFESLNECEFGDHIGYNETIERLYLKKNSFQYYHVPVGGYFRYDEEALIGHYCVLNDLFEDRCPILFHCRTGTRSAYFAILYLAITEGRSCSWALDTSRSIGYDFSSPSYPLCRVITSFQEGEHDESMQMSEAPVQNVFFVTGRYSLPVCSSQPSLKTLTLTQTPTPTQMLVQTPTQPPTPTYTLTPKQTRLGEYKYRKLLYANNIHMWQLTTDMPLIKII
jgi:protein tyrosine phosphatase (PTP) superfamily phosphohydrolase (DUF442 family)